MIRETGRHGRGARPITAWRLLSPPRWRHIELQMPRQVRTTEMVKGGCVIAAGNAQPHGKGPGD